MCYQFWYKYTIASWSQFSRSFSGHSALLSSCQPIQTDNINSFVSINTIHPGGGVFFLFVCFCQVLSLNSGQRPCISEVWKPLCDSRKKHHFTMLYNRHSDWCLGISSVNRTFQSIEIINIVCG